MTDMPYYYTSGEVARMLKVSPQTILRWIEIGRIPEPCGRTVRAYLWSVPEIDKFVEEQSREQ